MVDPNKNEQEKDKDKDRYQIHIDRTHYTVDRSPMTGAELRALASIAADRDLFEVVPGGTDRKIEATDSVTLRNGMRFFTAPSHINPGVQR
jgi:hypothetical protein